MTSLQFTCDPVALGKLTAAVTVPGKSYLLASELVYSPTERIEPPDEIAGSVEALLNILEQHDDSIRVWSNML